MQKTSGVKRANYNVFLQKKHQVQHSCLASNGTIHILMQSPSFIFTKSLIHSSTGLQVIILH